MQRIIFNRTIIRKIITTQEYHYIMVLFRNELDALLTGTNRDDVGFYRITKTIKDPKQYYPRREHEIDMHIFRKIEEAYDICIRR